MCYLVGLRDPLHAMQGPMAGAIMETAVVAELTKAYVHSGDEPRLAFWRTARGIEEFARTLAATKPEGLRPAVQPGYVVYAGDRVVPLDILRIHGRLAQG